MKPVRVITYGRGSRVEVPFPDDRKVSRVHCQIVQYDNGTFEIIDFCSKNGTWVNGHKIVPRKLHPIESTDVVIIGATTLQWMSDFTFGPNGGIGEGGGDKSGGRGGKKKRVRKVGNGNKGGGNSRGTGGNDGVVGSDLSLVVFLCGLVSIGIVGYILINYFTSLGQGIAQALGGTEATIKLFPIYLHGIAGGGQWLKIIAAIVIGGVADLVDTFNENDNGLSSAGLWLANTGISIAVFFLALAIFAPQIVQTY